VIEGAGALERGRPRALGQLLVTALLVSCAGVLFAALFTAIGSDDPEQLGWDFRVAYYPAAEAVVDGASPYPTDPGAPSLDARRLYVYPPQLAFLVAPLTVLPIGAAAVLAVIASALALVGALAIVGVRDIRCYAALFIWAPAWNALEMANVSTLLALLLALAWRYRGRTSFLAGALGVAVSLKLFLWPTIVWAAATRGVRSAVGALAIGAGVTALAWALIGFEGLGSYRELLERVATQESYSIEDVLAASGFDAGIGRLVALVVGTALVWATVVAARRGDHERSFAIALGAALAFTPILWLHYLVVLAVPLGIRSPRFSWVWLVPVALWVCPRAGNGDGLVTILPLALTALMLGLITSRGGERRAVVAS
jgi:hypothetical protein